MGRVITDKSFRQLWNTQRKATRTEIGTRKNNDGTTTNITYKHDLDYNYTYNKHSNNSVVTAFNNLQSQTLADAGNAIGANNNDRIYYENFSGSSETIRAIGVSSPYVIPKSGPKETRSGSSFP